MGRTLGSLVLLAALASAAHAQSPFDDPEPPKTKWDVQVRDDRDWLGARGVDPDGRHLGIQWSRDQIEGDCVVVFRREVAAGVEAKPHAVKPVDRPGPGLRPAFIYPSSPRDWHSAFDAKSHPIPPGAQVGEWTVIASVDQDPEEPIIDEVDPGRRYEYALVPARRAGVLDTYDAFGLGVATGAQTAEPAWFYKRRWFHLALIAMIGGALVVFARRKSSSLRALPAIDALEDAVGRPMLYVTGTGETQDIQTIASLLILGHVSPRAPSLRVANAYPLTMVIAQQLAQDALFVASQPFAFAAGVTGMMLRERPATAVYFGKFGAESLLLAETGFVAGAVQIAGTAELDQLPFFVTACDHTLIGEQLFAAPAYLTRAPDQIAIVKAGDAMKIAIAAIVVGFAVCATLAAANYYPFTRFSIEDVIP